MEQVKKEAGNEWLARMQNLYSFAAVLDTAGVVALGPDVAHMSASEAFLVSGQGMLLQGLMLLELCTEAVFNVVCSFLQHVFHLNVVVLFLAATLETLVKCLVGGDDVRGEFVAPGVWRSVEVSCGDDSTIGVYGVEEEGGSWLVVGEGINNLVLIEEEAS
jgi:hypothetical protein